MAAAADFGLTAGTTIPSQLKTNPGHTVAMLCQAAIDGTGLSFHELLPLVHTKALSKLHTGWVFVQLALRLRTALAVEEQDAFDRHFHGILKTSILSTLEAGPSHQMVRGRGVRNVKVLAEALHRGLVKPQQVTDIFSFVSCGLETQNAEQQDLRLLLLSHLLGDVYQSYGRTFEFRQRLLEVVPQSCVESSRPLCPGGGRPLVPRTCQ